VPPPARQVAQTLRAAHGRLAAVVERLSGLNDHPVPADVAEELARLATALRDSVAPLPPSATARDKAEGGDGVAWPRDLNAEVRGE
jgi:hypothetical protein